jgi:hypothetical protein
VTALTIAVPRAQPDRDAIAAVDQMPAAVVRPCTWPLCVCLITAPAPRKPTRRRALDARGSGRRRKGRLLRHEDEERGAERDSMWVRRPAALSRRSRSQPISAPSSTARPSRSTRRTHCAGREVGELVAQRVDDRLPHRRRLPGRFVAAARRQALLA